MDEWTRDDADDDDDYRLLEFGIPAGALYSSWGLECVTEVAVDDLDLGCLTSCF